MQRAEGGGERGGTTHSGSLCRLHVVNYSVSRERESAGVGGELNC